ncbi:hypothetical protein NECID01_0921 [Nematocida sp. AWRm77]|nr:hypothetical protein NECID01_0921 [Nematocida sp. AWRm77]
MSNNRKISKTSKKLNINTAILDSLMVTSPESYFDSFHKTPQGEFKSSYYNPFIVKPRKRTSKEQLEVLEKTFETNIKPDATLRKTLATKLGMTPRSVQVWFQNKRAKVKNEKHIQKEKPKEEIQITQSLYAKKELEEKEKTKEDYECFLLNYPGFNQEYAPHEMPTQTCLEEVPSFKEEDLQSLDKLILGEENDMQEENAQRKKPKTKKDGDSSYCSFYSMANSLQFDPSNYLN